MLLAIYYKTKRELTMIWLALFFSLMSSLQPYEVTKYEGLVAQSTPWDCASAAAASLFTLAGQSEQPRFEAEAEEAGASLLSLSRYFEARGWETLAYSLTWQQLQHFFEHSPNQPLLAHRDLDQGHYVVLLGLVQELLVVANPSCGVQAVPPKDFLEDFSGFTLYFPTLPALSTVEKILASVDQRLNLLRQSTKF
jgi:ABC-type bacteriocin/lantibiotic exporter with double-glycine peptidase domain